MGMWTPVNRASHMEKRMVELNFMRSAIPTYDSSPYAVRYKSKLVYLILCDKTEMLFQEVFNTLDPHVIEIMS